MRFRGIENEILEPDYISFDSCRSPLGFKYDLDDAENLFDEFVKDYEKVYKDAKDRKKHFEAFKKNLADINLKNFNEFPNAYFGMSKFADFIGD